MMQNRQGANRASGRQLSGFRSDYRPFFPYPVCGWPRMDFEANIRQRDGPATIQSEPRPPTCRETAYASFCLNMRAAIQSRVAPTRSWVERAPSGDRGALT